MKCAYPVGTYREDGSPTFRPCGSCIACRLIYARMWAVRCIHEASMHDNNCFVTLTYNDDNLPEDRSVSKHELKNFIRRLARKTDKKFRYFGAGEYGENFNRPHYHVCLFGIDFNDRELFSGAQKTYFRNRFKRGYDHSLYISKMLSKVWKKGFHSIGELTFESAGYTARYCTKKINGDQKEAHYNGRQPEFALMSRKPGIGAEWFQKYSNDVYPKDFVHIGGIKHQSNRYYDSLLKKMNPKMYEEVKQQRRCKKENLEYESHLRLWQIEKHLKSKTKTLKRTLENGNN